MNACHLYDRECFEDIAAGSEQQSFLFPINSKTKIGFTIDEKVY
jgi:hypothetical protein